MDTAYVINIQNYSLHDGPGIRTLVFLKGCPLRCKWCSNPESQEFHQELVFNKNKCLGKSQCGRCIHKCNNDAISFNKQEIVEINRQKCNNCLKCTHLCPSQALYVYGKTYEYRELLDLVEKDNSFYARSGGGLTVSGGEPLAQGDFTIKLLKEAKKRRINTAIETCGYAPWEVLKEAAQYLDTILFDIKSLDCKKHEKFTGEPNKLILDNFDKLSITYPQLNKIVRTPIIPKFNDSQEEKSKIAEYVKNYPNTTYEVLTYHRLGQPKYEYLGRNYPMDEEGE